MLALLPVLPAAAGTPYVTGLDPTQPLSAVVFSIDTTTVSASTTQAGRTVELRKALGDRNEFDIAIPYRATRTIAGVGSAAGAGDLAFRFTHLVGASERWRTAVGLGTSFATGTRAFSNGATVLAPFAAVSYAPLGWLHLIVQPSYAVAAAVKPGFAITQTLGGRFTALAALPAHVYLAGALEESRVTGSYRYTQRLARFTLGALVAGRYNVSAYVQMPAASPFTYSNVEQRAAGFSVSFQR